jgi:SOS-response transcriptional repressor LexA
MLTSKQAECLAYLKAELARTGGVCPSHANIQAGLKLSSKSGVTRLLNALGERGAIRRLPNRARAIEIVNRPPPQIVHQVKTVRFRNKLWRYIPMPQQGDEQT